VVAIASIMNKERKFKHFAQKMCDVEFGMWIRFKAQGRHMQDQE
jgi:hypothetical protein